MKIRRPRSFPIRDEKSEGFPAATIAYLAQTLLLYLLYLPLYLW